MNIGWSAWRPFPDPRKGDMLVAPIGPGCFEIRHSSGKLVLFGACSHTARRISSLLPKPIGTGAREDAERCGYCLAHIDDLEYRTLACATKPEALLAEQTLRANAARYQFA